MRQLGRRLLRRLQRLLPRSHSGTLILAYHLVGAGTASPVDLPVATFRAQLAELRRRARLLSLEQALFELRHADGRSTPTAAVVTFDDAYENFWTVVWPILQELQVPATLYVPVGFIDGAGPPPIRGTADLRALSWPQLQALAAEELITLGSHSLSHRYLPRLEPAQAEHELVASKAAIEARTGVAITSFCYPGARWSRRIERLVAKVYDSAVIAGGLKLHAGRTLACRLSRLPLRRDMPASLEPMLQSELWLEEAVAAAARRWVA